VSVVRLVARLVLMGVFTASGVAKALDPGGTRRAVRDFGVPVRWAGVVAVALPTFELATVGLLVWHGTAFWGGLLALVLLAVFGVAIAVNLGRGRTPDCHCFGRWRAEPVRPALLVRNAVFAVPAVLLVLTA